MALMQDSRQSYLVTLTLQFFIVALLTSHAFFPLSAFSRSALLFVLAFDAVMVFIILFSKPGWRVQDTYLFVSNIFVVFLMLGMMGPFSGILVTGGTLSLALVAVNMFICAADGRRKDRPLTTFFGKPGKPSVAVRPTQKAPSVDQYSLHDEMDEELSHELSQIRSATPILPDDDLWQDPFRPASGPRDVQFLKPESRPDSSIQKVLLESRKFPAQKAQIQRMPSLQEVRAAEDEIGLLREAAELEKAQSLIDLMEKKELQKKVKEAMREASDLESSARKAEIFERDSARKVQAELAREAEQLKGATEKMESLSRESSRKKEMDAARQMSAVANAFSQLSKATAAVRQRKIKDDTRKKVSEIDTLIKDAEKIQKTVKKVSKNVSITAKNIERKQKREEAERQRREIARKGAAERKAKAVNVVKAKVAKAKAQAKKYKTLAGARSSVKRAKRQK